MVATLVLALAITSAKTFSQQFSTPPTTSIRPLELLDIAGTSIDLTDPKFKATAVVFLGTECPVANKAIPKLNYLHRSFIKGNWAARVVGVLSDPTVGRKEAADWYALRKVEFPVIFDSSGELALALQPRRTPESFVVTPAGESVYRGRIDDTMSELGREKHDAGSYDLAAAVTDVLRDRPVKTPETSTIGCIFESWKRPRDESSPVTYTRDIAAIVNANCVTCHRAGEPAPFPLVTFEDVSKRAEMIASVTQSRYMPPWKAKKDFGHFLNERRLSDRQIELIQQWSAAGAPRGTSTDLPPAPTFPAGWQLGEPDLVLTMPLPLTIPANGRDIYRAFVMPIDLPDDAYVAAVEFRPGAATVVHHAIFYLDDSGRAREKDAADPLPGYIAFGGPGFLPTGSIGGWAPGAQPHRLPDDVGRFVPKHSDLVLQVHYHPDGVERVDQSSVAIYLQKGEVKRRVATVPLGTRDIDIAAGDANYTRSATFTLPIDATVTGVIPHMHLLGKEMMVTATKPDGDVVPMIHIDDWDFRWQDQYQFAQPLELPAGTVLSMTARYDNSAGNPSNPSNPPARVQRGEQTTDEMCVCFIEYLANSQEEIRTMRRALLVERLSR